MKITKLYATVNKSSSNMLDIICFKATNEEKHIQSVFVYFNKGVLEWDYLYMAILSLSVIMDETGRGVGRGQPIYHFMTPHREEGVDKH